MIELVMMACLIGSEGQCKEVKLQFLSDQLTVMQCMMGAQAQIAQWTESHPKYRVTRWKCRAGGSEEADL